MGWSSGTRLVEKVIKSVEATVSSSSEKEWLFFLLIENFRSHDWDNIDEVIGLNPHFDKAACKMFPEAFGGED